MSAIHETELRTELSVGLNPRLTTGGQDTYWRLLKFLSVTRLVIAIVLALASPVFGLRSAAEAFQSPADFQLTAWVYLSLAVVLWVVIDWLRPHFELQLHVQIVLDLCCLLLIVYFASGLRGGFAMLLIAPVAGVALMSSTLIALFYAACAAVGLLVIVGLRAAASDAMDASFLNAGLTGIGLFATAGVTSVLARRLSAQEALAEQRGADLRDQFAVNQLVINELAAGVAIVGADGAVQLVNSPARSLLNLAPADAMDQILMSPVWREIARLHVQWLAGAIGAGPHDTDVTQPVRLRVRFLRAGLSRADQAVVVMEDARRLEAQAQQLKLASMGRLSASIAHEIRNPLGAVRHANSLLGESLGPQASSMQMRMSKIIEDNALRINRIVEDVLSIAKRERPTPEQIDLTDFLAHFKHEFATDANDPLRLDFATQANLILRFDSNHLRQVLVNLVNNALRYASDSPGAVRIDCRRVVSTGQSAQIELEISDDGPGLPEEILPHLFEPFFTTEARGTGLGLYLARELCNSNDAQIRYAAPAAGQRGAFVIAATE
jgi:two-component system, NtrC family, sensor histidine kinase PilS